MVVKKKKQTSFKAGMKTTGDSKYSFNSLRFKTKKEAEKYADNLAGRWFAVTDYKIFKTDQPANYEMKSGKAHPLKKK